MVRCILLLLVLLLLLSFVVLLLHSDVVFYEEMEAVVFVAGNHTKNTGCSMVQIERERDREISKNACTSPKEERKAKKLVP